LQYLVDQGNRIRSILQDKHCKAAVHSQSKCASTQIETVHL